MAIRMDEDRHDKNGSRGGPKPAAGGRGVESAFDLWLERKLHDLYDSVAREPVPPELLRLIAEDRERRSG